MLIRTDAEAEEIAARQHEIPGSQRTSISVDTLLRELALSSGSDCTSRFCRPM